MKNAIETKNLSYSYQTHQGEINVLQNANITCEFGKITLIAGDSGCGKSTLFYLVNGVLPLGISPVSQGEVLICGENIKGKSIGEISRKVSSVFQNAEEQIIQKHVGEEIAFAPENLGKSQGEISKIVTDACKVMNLEKSAQTQTLSGGGKQRLITASALALENDIILLDEPLANLDKKSAEKLMEKLKDLTTQGKAVVIIEHRLDMVIDFVDEIYYMQDKKLEKISDKKEFLQSHLEKIDDICTPFGGVENILEINNVGYEVKGKKIIDNMTFQIKEGERVVILGDNGSGKTTITKIIARLITKKAGTVNQNIYPSFGNKKGSKKWFKNVAYVFQNPNYQLFMPTSEEEMLFSCHSQGYAQEIADMFGLEPILDIHPHALSQGQKRKLSIATMLAIKPKVLILDEPTVGQDYSSLKKLVDNINTIHKKENNTIITITHDIRCAEALCDKAIWIENGKVIKIGGKELVMEYYSNQTNIR